MVIIYYNYSVATKSAGTLLALPAAKKLTAFAAQIKAIHRFFSL